MIYIWLISILIMNKKILSFIIITVFSFQLFKCISLLKRNLIYNIIMFLKSGSQYELWIMWSWIEFQLRLGLNVRRLGFLDVLFVLLLQGLNGSFILLPQWKSLWESNIMCVRDTVIVKYLLINYWLCFDLLSFEKRIIINSIQILLIINVFEIQV